MGKKRGKSNPHFVLQHVKELLEHGAVHSKEVANIEAIEEQIQPPEGVLEEIRGFCQREQRTGRTTSSRWISSIKLMKLSP
jgi:hypothetical protein